MKNGFSRQQRLAAITLTFTSLALSLFAGLPLAHHGASSDGVNSRSTFNTAPNLTARTQLQQGFGKLPLSFEANQGQTDSRVSFLSRGQRHTLFLTATEAVMRLQRGEEGMRRHGESTARNSDSAVIRMRFDGANTSPEIAGLDVLPGKSNFLTGADQRNWRTDIPTFAKVNYDKLYPGIDLVFYGNQRQLEYDFVVAPGADPRQIKLNFTGAERVRLDEQGNLILKTAMGDIVQHAPVIYQPIETGRQMVSGSYALTGETQVAFQIGEYDANRPLVIDPVVAFATYLGADKNDDAFDVAVDNAGNVYLTGETGSSNFPATGTLGSNGLFTLDSAVHITKLNAAGSAILYSTLLDGNSGDKGTGIEVDEAGNAYVTGTTFSTNFPLVAPFQNRLSPGINLPPTVLPDADAFVAKLNAAGNALIFSTYLGGASTEEGFSIAVSTSHRVYVTGYTGSTNFPTQDEFQDNTLFSGNDAFITVFEANGQSLAYSSYLRGTKQGNWVAVDGAGNAYITGIADSNNLTTRGANGTSAFQASRPGGDDAFVAKFNPFASGNSSLVYSTYLGGSGTENGFAVAVDNLNQACVTGLTGSFNFPLQAAAGASVLDSTNVINEAFVTCLNANGSGAIFSTFLGGSGAEQGFAIAVDAARNVYVAGKTSSTNFPRVQATQQTLGGGFDGFLTKIAAGGTSILFSTYLGGSGDEDLTGLGVDTAGNVYLSGSTSSTNFPTTPGVLQPAAQGNEDGFVAKIAFANPDTPGVFVSDVAIFGLSNTLSPPNQDITVFFGQALSRPIAGDWDGDGVTTVGAFKNGVFLLTNTNTPGANDVITINFGQAGDIPVAGDWDGDGVDTIGLFRPAAPHQAAQFLLRLHDNTSTAASNQLVFNFGGLFDSPVVGDWDGDGRDSVGVFHAAIVGQAGEFRLVNENSASAPIFTVNFGVGGELPVAGDWDGDGVDTVGVFKNGTFRLRLHDNNSTVANNNLTVTLVVNSDFPLAGDWNGQP